jgi:uncharacterized RDD family membrane protein YckC
MPIRVRCQSCETVLNVPDQAAGKAVKCKQCGERVRVPVPREGAAARPRKKQPAAAAESPDDVLAGLDLRHSEDTKRKICPGCARPVQDEDIECPKCGVTIATGTLSDKQRRKIERKGPPPEEFYREVWGNSWKFLKKHWNYAIRTALIWSVCLTMSATATYSLNYYVVNRIKSLREMVDAAGPAITPHPTDRTKMILEVPKEGSSNVEFDGTYYTMKGSKTVLWIPEIQARKEPPAMFWMGMSLIFQLGFGGWSWTLATVIAGVTMSGEKKIKRFQFDFFANLTMGFRFYVWPVVLTLPLQIIAIAVAPFSIMTSAIMASAFLIIPLLVLPAAVVHMAQRYTHRAWLLTWMLKDLGKTIAPSLYVFVMNLFLVLLIPIAIGVAVAVMQSRLVQYLVTQEAAILDWLKTNLQDFGEGNLRFLFYQMPLVFSVVFVAALIVCLLMAFPAVFMMRVIGLYGLYFRSDLSIVNEFPDLEPVTFGPRFLAYLVDNVIMVLMAGLGFFIGQLFGLLFHFYGWTFADNAALGIGALATLGIWGFYFASGESGSARATLGKWSLGMIVLRDDNKVQTRQQAFGRAASAFVTVLTLYIGFLICLFRPDRKAMHDLMSKSKVVWQSEQT